MLVACRLLLLSQELFYRRSMGGDTDWEWSFDSDEWYSTADLSPVSTEQDRVCRTWASRRASKQHCCECSAALQLTGVAICQGRNLSPSSCMSVSSHPCKLACCQGHTSFAHINHITSRQCPALDT